MRAELNFKYFFGSKSTETHPLQVKSVIFHQLRVDRVLADIDHAGISLVPRPDQAFVSLTHQGSLRHDLGKLDVPYSIFEATKYEPAARDYQEIIDRHPADTILRLGGEQFVLSDPFLANLIYHHHPDTPQRPIAGLNSQRPTSPSFDWALTYLIVADRIVSAQETHRFYNHNGISDKEATIAKLSDKLEMAGLGGIIDLPKAVAVGYQTFSQLGF